ncbi:MAG: hypothetical protein WBN40_03550 [Pseudomonadales bacterium]
MAGLRNHKSESSGRAPSDAMPEMIDDFDELDGLSTDDAAEEASEKVRFAKSTDVRRRIEERLEVRLLRDELGMDDLDIE